jgi:DNA-binding response OmpR family regulator
VHTTARLLVVEDDRMFAELVCHVLRAAGHAVDAAPDLARARALASAGDYDGLVLDVDLPDGSGLALLAELRRDRRATPVLLLTGRDAPADVVRGLDAGADDYLAKPVDVEVLGARVRALLRRGGAARALAFGDVQLERGTYKVSVGGRRVSCTPKEFALLAYLVEHAERAVTRAELLEHVWEMTFDPGTNVVDVHVARLRGKLRQHGAAPRLATVRGAGYMLTLAGGDGG